MVCIYCNGKTKVTNSRSSKRAPGTWRRRQCLACHALFTSRESADLTQTHVVAHTDSSLEPFSRDILFISVYESCRHRKSAPEDAQALTDTITTALLAKSDSPTIPTGIITATSKRILQKFDPIAATYYGAYFS